jgi:Protein of unknown function (DUF3489)
VVASLRRRSQPTKTAVTRGRAFLSVVVFKAAMRRSACSRVSRVSILENTAQEIKRLELVRVMRFGELFPGLVRTILRISPDCWQILLDSVGRPRDEWTRSKQSRKWQSQRVIGLMHIFIIDPENSVAAYMATESAILLKSGDRFANARELSKLAAGWPGTRLVEIWNKLPNVKAVRRFTDRKTAIRRIWRAVEKLEPSPTEKSRTIVPALGRPPAKADYAGAHNHTKTERIVALLKRSSGATLKDIMAETGWQPHSVRGFISLLSKRFGFRIESFKRRGERIYRIPSRSILH